MQKKKGFAGCVGPDEEAKMDQGEPSEGNDSTDQNEPSEMNKGKHGFGLVIHIMPGMQMTDKEKSVYGERQLSAKR